MHRALGEHLAGTSARARPVGGHRGAPPRARRELRPRRRLLLRGGERGARQPPDAARHPLLPARAVVPRPRGRAARRPGTRRSRAPTACSGGAASALWHLEALRRIVRQRRHAARGVPRPAAQRALRLRRGAPRARVRAWRGAPPRSRTRRTSPPCEVEAEALVSDFLRELGDVQGALAACDRALAAFDPRRGRAVPPRLRGEVLRSRGILLRRVGRVREAVDAYVDAIAIFREVRRAAHGGAREERARLRDVRPGPLRGRHRPRARVDPDRPVHRRALPDRQDAHEHRPLLLPPRRRPARARLPEARPRGPRPLRRPGRLGRHAAGQRAGDHRARRPRRRRDLPARRRRAQRRHRRTPTTGPTRASCRPLLARAHAASPGRPSSTRSRPGTPRRGWRSCAFHFYAMAIEAAARVDLGEMHAATLVATTALGAVENLQGASTASRSGRSAPTRSSARARRRRPAPTSARSTTRRRCSTPCATLECASSSRSAP